MAENFSPPVLSWRRWKGFSALARDWSLEDAEEAYYQMLKAGLDRAAAAVLLVVLAPLILALGVLVKLTSRGPMFYSQVRLGKGGRPFPIYKLRTMRHNCEKESGARWATQGDPRITPLGRFLRAAHLDELPQLFNVLCGHMSLVGPRPERPEFVQKLEKAIPLYRHRLRVRPGVTGLAQVHLPPDTDLDSVRKKMAYDFYYIHQKNIWLDVSLILTTALHVLGVPFGLARRLFLVPDPDAIEPLYETRVTQGRPLVEVALQSA